MEEEDSHFENEMRGVELNENALVRDEEGTVYKVKWKCHDLDSEITFYRGKFYYDFTSTSRNLFSFCIEK